jgi:hypothetical protein
MTHGCKTGTTVASTQTGAGDVVVVVGVVVVGAMVAPATVVLVDVVVGGTVAPGTVVLVVTGTVVFEKQ